MKLYELYVKKVDPYTGWPEGLKRIQIFQSKGNAIRYKKDYESRWKLARNNVKERGKDKEIDVYSTEIPLVLEEVETKD